LTEELRTCIVSAWFFEWQGISGLVSCWILECYFDWQNITTDRSLGYNFHWHWK